jgi:hypothetical protein
VKFPIHDALVHQVSTKKSHSKACGFGPWEYFFEQIAVGDLQRCMYAGQKDSVTRCSRGSECGRLSAPRRAVHTWRWEQDAALYSRTGSLNDKEQTLLNRHYPQITGSLILHVLLQGSFLTPTLLTAAPTRIDAAAPVTAAAPGALLT